MSYFMTRSVRIGKHDHFRSGFLEVTEADKSSVS